MPKKTLLFITPAMPELGGNGLAIRAGNLVEILSADWAVHVVVLAVGGGEGRRWRQSSRVGSNCPMGTCLTLFVCAACARRPGLNASHSSMRSTGPSMPPTSLTGRRRRPIGPFRG